MSKKLFEDLLASYKKSNKERKLKLAQRVGFTTIEEYQAFLEESIDKAPKVEERYITDMVIAFDTTGSMSSYINAVKKHVKELIPTLFKQNPGLQVSVVAFGDYCDMVDSKTFGRAYQVIDLTKDENALISFVNNTQSTSGGDRDEFYELVIKKIVEETSWREGSSKSVLLIADCDPHKVGYSYDNIVKNAQIDWRIEAQKAASLDIQFDTLRIIAGTHWYQELSDITNGVCLDFSDSKKTNELITIANLARGGETTKTAFYSSMASNTDADLSKTYTMYKTIVER